MSFNSWIVLENGNGSLITNEHCPMDGLQLPEEVVKTSKLTKKPKTNGSKSPHSKFFLCLLKFLSQRLFEYMLRYVPGTNENEFEVIFIDKKSRKWEKKDIALFKALDQHLGNVFKRDRSSQNEEVVKIRFKSNMSKCVKRKFIKEIPINDKKKEKCKTVKRYRILWKPSVAEQSEINYGNGNPYGGGMKNYGKIKKQSCRNQNKAGNNIRVKDESFPMENNNGDNMLQEMLRFGNIQVNNSIHLNDNHYDVKFIVSEGFVGENKSTSHYLCLSGNSQVNVEQNEDYSKVVLEVSKIANTMNSMNLSDIINVDRNGDMDLKNADFTDSMNACSIDPINVDRNGDMDLKNADFTDSITAGLIDPLDLDSLPSIGDLNDIEMLPYMPFNSEEPLNSTRYKNSDGCINADEYSLSINQGNQNVKTGLEVQEFLTMAEYNDRDPLLWPKYNDRDPLLCSPQKEKGMDFPFLGGDDEWSCNYQRLSEAENC